MLSINDISNRLIDYNGVKIAGLSGSFGGRGENYSQYNSLDDVINFSSADILITHDVSFRNSSYRVGLIGIDYYLIKNKINYHIHGHLHKNYEKVYLNGTREICAYMYRIINI